MGLVENVVAATLDPNELDAFQVMLKYMFEGVSDKKRSNIFTDAQQQTLMDIYFNL